MIRHCKLQAQNVTGSWDEAGSPGSPDLRNRFKAEIAFLFEQQKGEQEPSLFLASAPLTVGEECFGREIRLSVVGSRQNHLWLEKSTAPFLPQL